MHNDFEHDTPEHGEAPTAAKALDAIRIGGNQLVFTVLQRCSDVEEAVKEGRFSDAHDRAQEMLGRLGPLASAEQYLGTFKSSFVVRAADVHEGMVLRSWGRVVNVEHIEFHVDGEPTLHINILCEDDDEPKHLAAEQELVANRDS